MGRGSGGGGRGRSGGGGAISSLVEKTQEYIEKQGYPENHVYKDRDARTTSEVRSPEELRREVGDPIVTKEIWGKKHEPLSQRLLRDHLEDNAGRRESLSDTLKRVISNASSRKIDLRDITHTQEFVFTKPLKRYIKSKNYRTDDLYVIRHNGKYYLNDNNHRVAAAKINGVKSLNFKVIDID